MAKIITADSFPGQKLIQWTYGYQGSTSTTYIYPTGMTTTSNYPYIYWPMTFNGKLVKATLRNNPYSSYTSGPTGTGATLLISKNGSLLANNTQSYTAGTAGQMLNFSFSNATFSASDYLVLSFNCDGLWRYVNWMFEFETI